MLVVEQSGNGGGAKKAKTGGSGKETQAVAAADKQDSSGKQYCKIHRTKRHDLQSCKKAEQLVEQQKAEYERRDKEKEDAAPTRKGRRRNNKRKKGKEVLAVEQTGNGGGAKKAKAGSSGKEIAAGTNYQAVAVTDKQDATNKQYYKIHRTKGHDLQSCKKVEQLVEQQKAEYERRDKEKAQEGAGGAGKKRLGR